ncbi:MAG: type IV-A pilus assembly ATPase PilB [Pseudomonadota bacterium]
MPSQQEKLGELLVRQKLISLQELQKAQEEQQKEGGNLGFALAKLGILSEKEITTFLSQQYRVPAIELAEYEIDAEVVKLISKDIALKHKVMPIARVGSSVILAMVDPSNLNAIDDVKFLTGYNVEPVVTSEAGLMAAIELHYEEKYDYGDVLSGFEEAELEFGEDQEEININDLEKMSADAPVVKLVNMIIFNAIKKESSDIHVEPYEKFLRIRYRIDGVLHEEMKPPLKLKNAIVSRLKIMSSLDIAERRLPQDGRIKLKIGKEKEMDFRVSVLPTLFGEKVVMRILDKSSLQLDMTKLGFEAQPLEQFKEAIYKPYGMVLVTGPTGSGKTTSLYSALTELNRITHNISTSEDPVEYNLPGINQVQMHEEIGLNFATALRSFLRQDPDIIMVGEIRDYETAEIAVKAALTGHLVLSTLHTNDAPSSITRLLNMGVEPFLVTASVNLIMAQRLIRKLCVNCKQEVNPGKRAMMAAGFTESELEEFTPMGAAGCKTCSDTGYKGRIALYEVMPFDEELKEMVLQGASSSELKAEAARKGMATLRRAGLNKIKEGVSALDEVLRVTAMD